jgi:hypothetical protein
LQTILAQFISLSRFSLQYSLISSCKTYFDPVGHFPQINTFISSLFNLAKYHSQQNYIDIVAIPAISITNLHFNIYSCGELNIRELKDYDNKVNAK